MDAHPILVLNGASGFGKTSLSKELQYVLDEPYIDPDRLRERQ